MSYRNLAQLHRLQAERLGSRPTLRYKRHGLWHDVTWADYHEQSWACAAALVQAGVRVGDRVGLLADNSVEWLLADMGILAAGAVNVPPHAPLTARQVLYQFRDAGVSWAFVADAQQLAKIKHVRAELPDLRGIVVFDRRAAGSDAQSWDGFLQKGRQSLPELREELLRREQSLGGDSLATVMYTSGTTGEPKGVMLTHGNLLSNAQACNDMCPRREGSVLLSWLPFSHIYGRTVDHYLSMVAGAVLALAPSPETVVENLGEIQPTHLSCVPRFYEKVLAAVAAADPELTGKRLRGLFGPRIEWLSSGGAPLPPAIAHAYLKAGLRVLQGYGLTESAPVISFNRPENFKLETVGQPIPGIEVRIADDGEILTRGPHVMTGYWNNPQATAEAIRDGWLYTGDLGQLDEDGFLSVTGRKKELMVMSSGKKLVPSHIEGLLLADPCIDQVVVFGEGRNFLTALIVPNWDNLRRELQTIGVEANSQPPEILADNPVVKELLAKRMDAALKDVSSWEHVKEFAVLLRPFTVAGEELTVSLKLRRSVIEEKYRSKLQALYQ
jgi:long-chain acyl-CoA synthetase